MFINKIHTQFEGTPYAFRMIAIEGNIDKKAFNMGGESRNNSASLPVHKVQVSDFYMGEYLVTQDLWAYIMRRADKANPSYHKGGKLPIEHISWNDIVNDFLPKLNKDTEGVRPEGTKYRLPTEAEWEYAARGGKHWDKYPFVFSGSDKLDEVAWYSKSSFNETQCVGLKTPNLLGFYDMSGNVWEWCQDWYNSEFYKKAAALQSDPCNIIESLTRVHRGGCYFSDTQCCRPTHRFNYTPFSHNNIIGFRLVLSLIVF